MVGGIWGARGQDWAVAPRTTSRTGWRVEVADGTADDLHHRPIGHGAATVVVKRALRRALVLGSTQPEGLVDRRSAEAADIEVCRRRSGGGLVALDPEHDVWIDVEVGRTSRLWDDDVGRAFHWLGSTWAGAVAEILGSNLLAGGDPADGGPLPHHGPLEGRQAGAVICFAGLGPGEVTVAGRKVVGLSQRRTRATARFQCLLTPRWQPSWFAPYLDHDALSAAGIDLDRLRVGLPESADGPARDPGRATGRATDRDPDRATGRATDHDRVVEAFLRHLPIP